MTAVTATVARQPRPAGLPAPARRYLLAIVATTGAAAAAALTHPASESQWRTAMVLLLAGLAAQFFAVHTPKNQVFHTGLALSVAGALLLPPSLVVLLCVTQHTSDWAKQRYPWYIQTFNISNFVLSALLACEIKRTLGGLGHSGAAPIAASAAAAFAFVVVNHVLLAHMLDVARGHSLKETGLFSLDGLATDLGLAGVGAIGAVLWTVTPAAAALAIAPLVAIHRGFAIPNLEAEASRDPKTDLLNARAFERLAEGELARAIRFGRPLALLLLDVDDLRGINNRHGHLAGDQALQVVAEAFAVELREYDIAARFGGDEFAVLLPETTGAEAHEIAEQIGSRVKVARPETNQQTYEVTVSIGVAESSHSGESLETLLRRADARMYVGKAAGGDHVSSVG